MTDGAAPNLAGKGTDSFFKREGWRSFYKSRHLLIILLPGIVYYLIFCYGPMFGIVTAFQKYSPFLGVLKSPFVGLKHFQTFFGGIDFMMLFRNTLRLGVLSLLWGFPLPILFAIILNECRFKMLRKGVQTVSYLPSFISVVIVCSMAIDLLSPRTGLINRIIVALGGEAIYFMTLPQWFSTVYIGTGLWSGLGTGAIVYLAALSNIDPQLFEAAKVDGCGRIKAVWHITLPSILPTISTMLIINCGSIINVGHEKILLLYNPLLYSVSDVFSTYTYRMGIFNANYSLGAAVGLFNSVASLILVVATNSMSRRFSETSLW